MCLHPTECLPILSITERHSAQVVLCRDDWRLPTLPWHPWLGPRPAQPPHDSGMTDSNTELEKYFSKWNRNKNFKFNKIFDITNITTILNWWCPLCSQDVTPYMNPCPYTVSPNTHISQVFNLFRTMGLRHLPVVNAVGEVSSHQKQLFYSKMIKVLVPPVWAFKGWHYIFYVNGLIMTHQGKLHIKTMFQSSMQWLML